MSLQIIESQTIGKKNQETCEDAVIAATDFIAVIDGSTSKSPTSIHPKMSNGQYAMTIVANALQAMPAQVKAEQFCHFITMGIQEAYDYHQINIEHLADHPAERLTCSAAIYSIYRQEIWMIGDCQCMVNGILHENPKPHEQPNAEKRAAEIKRLLQRGYTIEQLQTHDLGRDVIIDAIIESTYSQNKTYSVIDGFHIPINKVKIIDCSNAKEIVLATDGYPFLFPSLKDSEDHLASILKEDPLCYQQFKATKGMMKGNLSFDDRAYIRFTK